MTNLELAHRASSRRAPRHPDVFTCPTLTLKEKRRTMTKFLNKWLRKIHRLIAVPTALLIPIRLTIEMVGNPATVEFWAKWEKLPSILMLFMAVTGAYLYLLPYIARRKRKNKVAQV
jgi:hypothetical protein